MSKAEVYKRDNGKCFYCGASLTFNEASYEHLLAKTHGGSDNKANMTIACKTCNLEAGQLSIVKKVYLREEKQNKTYESPPEWNRPPQNKITRLNIGDIDIIIEEPPK